MFTGDHSGATSPSVAASVDELLAGATYREPMTHSDSKSGARLERVVIDGEPHIVKWLDYRDDWTLRSVGDLGGATLTLWRRGILQRLPDCIDQPIVGVAHDPPDAFGGSATVLLMRDVGPWFVPPGDDEIPLSQQLAFLDHMAALHAAFWETRAEIDFTPITNRYLELSPWTSLTEATIASDTVVPRLFGRGWELLPRVAPRAADAVLDLAWDPSPLAAGLARTPLTFVHGNWKLGNLGSDPQGRTVLVDWESPGRGPACGELAWYLAVNCARLPHSKEEAIEAYRAALERRGVDTEGWWATQLALALLGGLVWFGWEKALGGYGAELAWWEERAVEGRYILDHLR